MVETALEQGLDRQPKGLPADWRDQLRDGFSTPGELLAHLGIEEDALGPWSSSPFPQRIPRPFVQRMRRGDPNDPLLRQVLPRSLERDPAPEFGADPVGELERTAAPGLLHKYEGRVLLIATGACAVHCRYCFRREFPYAEHQHRRSSWLEAIAYVAARKELREVILSGGDPWVLGTQRLRELTDGLADIRHLRRLRIHTRLPVVLPERVTASLLSWLEGLPWPVTVVVHANHAREFDPAVAAALTKLRAAGVWVLNQSVLLRGINDSEPALAELAETAFEAGALPYYLHLLDRVRGSAHFEVPEHRARDLVEGLRRRLSGYLVPRLVREAAGAPYKLPVL